MTAKIHINSDHSKAVDIVSKTENGQDIQRLGVDGDITLHLHEGVEITLKLTDPLAEIDGEIPYRPVGLKPTV